MIFLIPVLPVSVNTIYGINFKRKLKYLTQPAVNFKNKAKMYMPPRPKWLKRTTKVELMIIIFTDLYFKNGKVRKFDLQNMEKILIDAISEKYGHDDCYIWKKVAKKSQEGKWKGVGVCIRPYKRNGK